MSHDEEVLGRAYDHRLMRRLLGCLRPHRARLVLAGALVLLESLVLLAGPYLTKEAIDRGIRHRNLARLDRVALLYLAMLAAAFVLGYLHNQIIQRVGQRVMLDLRMALFRQLQRLPVSYFDRTPIGRIMTRVTNDVDTLNELATAGVIAVFGDLFTVVGVVFAMVRLNAELLLVTFSVLPLIVIVSLTFRLKVRKSFREIRTRLAHMNAFLNENLTGMGTVQLLNREARNLGEFRRVNAGHRDANLQAVLYHALFFPLLELVGALAVSLIVWYGGRQVMWTGITLGTLVAFIQYTQRFFRPISDLSEKYNILQQAMASAERIFDLLETPAEPAPWAEPLVSADGRARAPQPGALTPRSGNGRTTGDGLPAPVSQVGWSDARTTVPGVPGFAGPSFAWRPPGGVGHPTRLRRVPERGPCGDGGPEGRIEFDRVWFAYQDEDWVVRDVSFEVGAGERVALVGATGSGKSTLTSLLLRFYDAGRGQIRVDGQPLADWPRHELRRRMGLVLQDPFLFSGTIESNLRFGDPALPREVIERAAREVGAHDFIDRLPGGYRAEVRERGSTLSAGQRQLLAFARTLAGDPRILILDEATSSVDTQTEQLIQAALRRLMRGRTSLVIAHRLSTIQNVDRIVVLHHGRVREIGTHAELIGLDGIYSRLYQLQYLGGRPGTATPTRAGSPADEATGRDGDSRIVDNEANLA